MKKILCPTDFSPTADNAIVFAAKIAKRLNADLQLFNVQLLAELTPAEALSGRELNVYAAKKAIEERCLEVAKVFKISCHGEVSSSVGSLPMEIERHAGTCEMIVMGTNGADSLFQYIFGSNTESVLRRSSVPVLVVPEKCIYSEVKTIVFAFDYWRENRLPLTQIKRLAKSFQSKLVVLQVMEKSYIGRAEQELMEWRKSIMEWDGNQVPIEFDVTHTNNVGEGLDEYVEKRGADVLALCAQDRGFMQNFFHKSIIKQVSRSADYPVYVFHEWRPNSITMTDNTQDEVRLGGSRVVRS